MELSRCARGGGFDCFQCLLRPDPAAAVFFWLRGRWAKSQGRGRSKGVLVDCVWSSEGGGVRVVCGWCEGGGAPWDRLRGVLLVESIQGYFQKN
jgi:hypothetical protein